MGSAVDRASMVRMAAGDHIRVQRRVIWHHGIDMGDGTVIHASGEPGRLKLDAEIRRDSMEEFLRGGRAERIHAAEALPARQVTERAESALGGRDYSLFFNNCEHFARWCQSGRALSEQVDYFALAGTAVGIGARVALLAAARRGSASLALRALPIAGPLATALAVTGTVLAVSSRVLDLQRDFTESSPQTDE